MVLKVVERRSVHIDITKWQLGDILKVRMDQGTIGLIPARAPYQLRSIVWLYTNSSWLAADRREIERLKQSYPNHRARDMDEGHITVKVTDNIGLDLPLECRVYMSWGEDRKRRRIEDCLGTFTSRGGLIREVTASTIVTPI